MRAPPPEARTDRLQWLLLAVALVLAPGLFSLRGHPPAAGSLVEAALTLITADRDDLSCALSADIGRYRCRFHRPGGPPASAGAGVLQPFVSLDGVMYLVPDLFAQPALAARYWQEPPAGKSRQALRRFTASCRLRLLRQVDAVYVRFGPAAAWGPVPSLWVAEALSCRVSG